MFPGSLGYTLAGRALSQANIAGTEVMQKTPEDQRKYGRWSIEALDIRAFSTDKHASVDDTPFGGGAGMVLRPDVVDAAITHTETRPGPILMLSPRGRLLDQAYVRELAAGPGVRLICGRFEGVDQRVLDHHDVQEVSIGDYVLSGGEPAAIILLDAIVRLLPDVMGNQDSGAYESHENDLLEHPHYTRPAEWQNHKVPDVLLSGHHKKIEAWRRTQAEKITQDRRPDLWRRHQRKLES